MSRVIIKVLFIAGILYVAMCIFLYFIQERLLFFPEKLPQNYRFAFTHDFEELKIEMEDEILLNGILFKIQNPKGLIFYLHGNAGSLRTWGEAAKIYTDMSYDLFMLDYRGYGKSEGKNILRRTIP